ncbi:MAG: hypothetical protein GX237_03710 [Clostridiales bacterium]|nr:hypothetical protein [Clostridiales bacterium]
MIQKLYYDNLIIYGFAVLCVLGLLIRIILNIVYIYLVKESDRLGSSKNKLLKHMKLKFETCYKLSIPVNNVDTFVDKNMTRYKFCGFLLSTWENFSGQVLYLSFLVVPISAVFGVVYEIGQKDILYTGAVGILVGSILILVDKTINLSVKKQTVRLNILDYLENLCKVRLEHELSQPEKLDQFRQEYYKAISKTEKREVNRREEARKKKEEEKRLKALKKEEERRRAEAARKEEERRKMEERKRIAAKRREEELRKLQEERQALALQREDLNKELGEKEILKEERVPFHNVIEQQERVSQIEVEEVKEGIEEIALAKEETPKIKLPHMSPEEEQLIEDVLREFFA